jgi:hypothetical protein
VLKPSVPLYGSAYHRQLEDGRIGVLPPEKTFVLEALGSGEQAGIDRGGADRGTGLSRGFANCVEKRTAGILHEMPAVGDLGGVWQRLGRGKSVATAAVARHYGDLRLP